MKKQGDSKWWQRVVHIDMNTDEETRCKWSEQNTWGTQLHTLNVYNDVCNTAEYEALSTLCITATG